MAEFSKLTQAEFAARRRGSATPRAVSARFDGIRRRVIIELDSGLELAFDPARAAGLGGARDAQLGEVTIVGAGSALRFAALDVDFSIPRLLEGFVGPLAWERKIARAEASRRNGAKGGRPRKVAA